MWDVALFLWIVLARTHNFGWLDWLLPTWAIIVVPLGIFVIAPCLLIFLPPRFADLWRVWVCPIVFGLLTGLGSRDDWLWFWYYASIIGLICWSIFGLYEIVALLSDPGGLLLDENGFEIQGPLRKTYRVQWANSSNFEVKRSRFPISPDTVVYDNAAEVAGARSFLPDTYEGFTPESHAWTAPGCQGKRHVASLVGAAMCSACWCGFT